MRTWRATGLSCALFAGWLGVSGCGDDAEHPATKTGSTRRSAEATPEGARPSANATATLGDGGARLRDADAALDASLLDGGLDASLDGGFDASLLDGGPDASIDGSLEAAVDGALPDAGPLPMPLNDAAVRGGTGGIGGFGAIGGVGGLGGVGGISGVGPPAGDAWQWSARHAGDRH